MTVGALAARPFYHEFAWAYDLLVPRPVADECAGLAAWLARRGFVVTAVDRSPELLAEAAARARDADRPITLAEADLGARPNEPLYDAVVCRGVLNDVLGAAAARRCSTASPASCARAGSWCSTCATGTSRWPGRRPGR